jgi:hypothetical protein
MYHRYGRHGPHAWRRRRERRFQRHLPAIVPPVAIVRIYVPITAERVIIIIMQQPERFDEHYNENAPAITVSSDARLLNSAQEISALDEAQNALWLAGQRRSLKEKRLGDIPSYDELAETTSIAISDYLEQNPQVTRGVRDIRTLVPTLEQQYLEGYCQPFKIAPGDAEAYFQKNQTRDIRKRALKDREDDARNNVQLSQTDIEQQGAIRAVKERNIVARSGTYYMQLVRSYVKAYAKYYTGEESEEDRSSRSSSFPGRD